MKFYYALDENNVPYPVPDQDLEEYLDSGKISRTIAHSQKDGSTLTTIFLGINLSVADDPHPILFETWAIGEVSVQCYGQYRTYEEAIAGHDKALGLLGHKVEWGHIQLEK